MPVRSSFFCRTGPEVVVNGDFQLLGDDGGERGLAQAGRAVEQHVVHRLAAHFGGLDGDGEVLFELGLSGEIGQPARAQARFELQIFGLASRRKPVPGRACATSLPYQFQRPPEERLELGSAGAARPWPCAPRPPPAAARSPD